MGILTNLKELAKSFIDPIEPEKDLKQLLEEDFDLDDDSKKALLSPEIDWEFADGVQETKKGKKINSELNKEKQKNTESKPAVAQEEVAQDEEERDAGDDR